MPALLFFLKFRPPRRKAGKLLIGAVIVALASIQLRNLSHIFPGQPKVQNVQIVFDVIHIPAARNHHETHLRMPAEDHLRRCFAVLPAKPGKDRLADERRISVSKRIPAHKPDAVLVKRFPQLLLCKVRMRLHLDKLRRNFPFGFKLPDILSLKIRDADGLCPAVLIRLFKLSVARHPIPGRLMDVEKIDIIHAKTLQCLIHGVCVLILTRPELCGNEYFLTFQAALLHSSPAGSLREVLSSVFVKLKSDSFPSTSSPTHFLTMYTLTLLYNFLCFFCIYTIHIHYLRSITFIK